jgi:alpha-ribazole phosphatase/probable phosphoglycerate mutase
MEKNASAAQELGFISIYLVRHGQIKPKAWENERTPWLSSLGERQAEKIAERLAKVEFKQIYTSDTKRAKETTDFIKKYHPSTPVIISQDIREISHIHNRRCRIPIAFEFRKNIIEQRKRVRRFYRLLMKSYKLGENVLIVAHGNLIRLLISMLAQIDSRRSLPLETHNTALFIIKLYEQRNDLFNNHAVLSLANSVEHLGQKERSL